MVEKDKMQEHFKCHRHDSMVENIFNFNSKKMKKITVLFAVMMMAIMSGAGNQTIAQEKKKSTEEIKIQTSAVCGMCKERIEHDLAFEKGVKSVSLDNETKIVTVGYSPKKTNPDNIRLALSRIGYDADDVKADPVAYDKLPGCCKKSNKSH